MELARRITVALDDAHLSSVEVAAACGVSPQAVNGWKKTGRIGKDQLPKLVELTGRPLSYWLGSDDENGASQAPSAALERLTRIVRGRSAADVERIADALEILLSAPRPFGMQKEEDAPDTAEVVIAPPAKRRRRDRAA